MKEIRTLVLFYSKKKNLSAASQYGRLYGEIYNRLNIDLYAYSDAWKVRPLKVIKILNIETKAINIAREIFQINFK